MHKRLVASVVGVLVLNLLCVGPVSARSEGDAATFAERVRSEIVKLGAGPEAQIEVKLQDKTRLKGFIREADETQFVIVDSATGVATTVEYPQVRKVKGNNLSSGVKIAIGVGIALLAIVVFCKLHGCQE